MCTVRLNTVAKTCTGFWSGHWDTRARHGNSWTKQAKSDLPSASCMRATGIQACDSRSPAATRLPLWSWLHRWILGFPSLSVSPEQQTEQCQVQKAGWGKAEWSHTHTQTLITLLTGHFCGFLGFLGKPAHVYLLRSLCSDGLFGWQDVVEIEWSVNHQC